MEILKIKVGRDKKSLRSTVLREGVHSLGCLGTRLERLKLVVVITERVGGVGSAQVFI